MSCNGGTLQYAVHYNQQQCTAMCDGSYSIEILNGVGPYNYTITGPSYSHNNAIDSLLCPGAYSALVEDVGQGVSCTLNFNVDTLVPMTYSPGIIGETGTGSCDGVAWQSVSGGVPDYNYTWYDASYTPIPLETDSLMDTLCPGVYYVVVTDSPEGCVPSNSGFLQIAVPYSPIILTITSVVEEYCFMDCTAHFTYTVTGGSGVYNWEWNGSPYSMYNSTTSDIFCVPPYIGLSGSLEVWDDQGGYAVAFISWQGWPLEPWVQASPTDASCGNCDGTITFDDSYWNYYDYRLNSGPWQTSPVFTDLCPGTYEIEARLVPYHCLVNGGTIVVNSGAGSSNTGTDSQTTCDSYTWIDGNTYNSSNNTATHVLTNVSGCDSTVTLDLTITNSTTGTDSQTTCDSYTWIDGNTYTASNNTATHVLTNVSGCDSIVTLDLIINSVDTNVTQVDGVTLMSDAVGALYQWLDCGNGFAEILGETNQIFVAISNGNYAVEVSENNCIDTSACFSINVVGIYDDDFGNSITVLPNPTKDFVTINLDKLYSKVQIKIMDLQGKIISTDDYIQVSHFEVPILGGTGIYFLQIIAEGKGTIVRVVKTD